MSVEAQDWAYIRERETDPGAEEGLALVRDSRGVPDDQAATPDEVVAAIEALSGADSVRLKEVARYRIRGLGRKAQGRGHEDLLQEAIRATLEPTGRKWNKRVSFVTHLIGAMRSIAGHWGKEFHPDEPRLESGVARVTDQGDLLSPIDQVASREPGAERILVAKEEIERIEKVVADDKALYDILGGFRAEMLPIEIREVLELPQKEYETTMKRFRRRVRPTAGQGGNNA